MFWNWLLPSWVKKLVSLENVNISITSKTVTINGKQHVCKKEPCSVCEAVTKVVDEANAMVDTTMKHVDRIIERVDKMVEEEKE